MDPRSILQPVCAQVLLTFVVWFWMYSVRLPAIKRSGKDAQALADEATANEVLASSANQSDNLINLFEMPVLFFAGMLVLFGAGIADSVDLSLGWAYVALRTIHSFVHCSYNRVAHRFAAYIFSSLVLLAIWIRIGIRLFS